MFKKLKHNKNYKLIIGLVIGFFISSTVASALYLGTAAELSYNHSNTWLTATTVQGALDELYKQKGCPVGYACYQIKTTLEVGDYISYTPSKTSYTTDKTQTGNTGTDTINPSELTLWRVLNINQDGTVDIISEYASSTTVSFGTLKGYKNFVGYLNVLASQYETAGVTVGSRYFGYDDQTEYITDTTNFTSTTPPWTCSTSETCSPDPDDYEIAGGGDVGYLTDYNRVGDILGTYIAKKAGTTAPAAYWVASRHYKYNNTTSYNLTGRCISSSITTCTLASGPSGGNIVGKSLRPIVTLKSGLTYRGGGVKNYPMTIQ